MNISRILPTLLLVAVFCLPGNAGAVLVTESRSQAGSLDLYMYAGGNPVNNVDATGLLPASGAGVDMLPGRPGDLDPPTIQESIGSVADLASVAPVTGELMDAAQTGFACGQALTGQGSLATCAMYTGLMMAPGASIRIIEKGRGLLSRADRAVDLVRKLDDMPHGTPATRGAGTVDEAFHHTFGRLVESIQRYGLRPGTYATPTKGLSPLQAQIELALPPGRGLPGATLRVDVAGLRAAGYEIPSVSRVSNVVPGAGGRVYSMPGGGYEMQFPYAIPPEFISVVP